MAFNPWHFIGNESRSCLDIKARVTWGVRILTLMSLGEPAAMLTEKFMFVNINNFAGLCSD